MNRVRISKKLFLPLLLIIPFFIKAQLRDEYLKANIVLKNNERKTGFISNVQFAKISSHIDFKQTLQDKKTIKYDTSQINEILVEDSIEYKVLRYKPELSKDTIRAIGRLILKGKASLYKTFYRGGEVYIVSNNGKFYPLQNDELVVGDNEITHYYYKSYFKEALIGYDDIGVEIDKMVFGEKEIVRIISAYNEKLSSKSILFPVHRDKIKHFVFVDVEGMIKNSNESEFGIQGTYRIYFPNQSRSTSINIGLNYYSYKFSNQLDSFSTSGVFTMYNQAKTQTLISLPITIQQNILNRSFRPYVLFGEDLTWVSDVINSNKGAYEQGVQNNLGLGIVFGVGIEADLATKFRVKGEYKHESYTHLLLLGLGYYF